MTMRRPANGAAQVQPGTDTIFLADDGRIPNNETLPLVVHRRALAPGTGGDLAAAFEEAFARNGWRDGWRNGIFAHHHYHATAHEALGIAAGRATVRFGGENGVSVEVAAGDLVVIPAGVGHKNLGSTPDFLVVGAYPAGQRPDMNTGTADEHARALATVPRVPLPTADPVFGSGGPLVQAWGRSC